MQRKRLARRAGDTGPNFLFSTPPWIEWGQVPTILMHPSGGDDSARFATACERLGACGGGTVRLTEGEYRLGDPAWLAESVYHTH